MLYTNLNNEFGESYYRKEKRDKKRQLIKNTIITIILITLATISLSKLYIAYAEVREMKDKNLSMKEVRQYLI
jgi:hypothetical protein